MTEPQKMGVETITGLIAKWFWAEMDYRKSLTPDEDSDRDERWGAITDALTTIIEERDRAVMSEYEIMAACSHYEKERDALLVKVGELEKAVIQIWPDIGSIGPAAIYCRFCDAKAEWIQVATGLEHPPLSEVQHAPDCIVRTISPQP